ncbi:hypothetical protein [Candidatus Phytoplasma rubi]
MNENQEDSSTWTSFLINPQIKNIPQYYLGPSSMSTLLFAN